jgi:hypothetical protein
MWRSDAGDMTASLYVTGTHVASVERHRVPNGTGPNRVIDTLHAVARPVVDGLDASVCGLLVTASADVDWQTVWGITRCQECARITG